MIAAIVVPAGIRSIARMRACLVSGRIAVFEEEGASRVRELDLLVDREAERAAAFGFDLGLVMGSSEVRATPSAAPPLRRLHRSTRGHYERSHPIRGWESNATRTPVAATTATDVIDTSKGTVHMVIGGGGTSAPTNQRFFNPPQCRVITAVGEPDPATGKRPSIYVKEQAPWSAVRNAAHSYGFAAFSVDPGSQPGGFTAIKVTYYDVVGPDGQLAPFETFTLRRPRRD
jgi:hypothetical protein